MDYFDYINMDPILAMLLLGIAIVGGILGPILINRYLLPKHINDDGELEGFVDTNTKEGVMYVIGWTALGTFTFIILSLLLWFFIIIGIIPIVGLIFFTYRYFTL